MATIVSDILNGNNSLTINYNGPGSCSRTLLIHNCSGSTAGASILDAVTNGVDGSGNHLTNLGIGEGLQHPDFNLLYCGKLQCKLIDKGIVEITVEYTAGQYNKKPDDTQPVLWRVGCSIQSEQTNKDYNGDLLNTTYNGKTYTATADVNTCIVTLEASRKEAASTTAKASYYADKLNDSSITLDGFTYPARTLICHGIPSQGDAQGNYAVQYLFSYKEDGWDQTIVYKNKDGSVPTDVTDGNGLETKQMYIAVDFDALGLA